MVREADGEGVGGKAALLAPFSSFPNHFAPSPPSSSARRGSGITTAFAPPHHHLDSEKGALRLGACALRLGACVSVFLSWLIV